MQRHIGFVFQWVADAQSPYSRKCPERPYESLMSIIAKFPWHRGEYYTVLQRDHLFEALKSIPSHKKADNSRH